MPDNLKTQAIQSVKWNTLSIGAATLLQVIQMIWLARYLDPSDFGKMAMVWVVIRMLNPLVQGGLSQAIVRNASLSKVQFSSLFWFNIGMGILVFLGVWGTTPFLATFFRTPDLQGYLVLAGISFLVLPWGSTIQATLTRDLKFKKLAAIQSGSQLAELVASVVLAYRGVGVWALIGGLLARTSFSALLSLALGWKEYAPLWQFRWKEISSLLSFAAFETGSLSINSLSTQIDKAIIGRLLGPHYLGLYTIAWELIVIPAGRINPLLMRVAYPVFSKIQEETEKLNHYFQKTLSTLMLINMPALVGLAIVAGPFLQVVYGTPWREAATALSILSVAGIAKAFISPGSPVLLARGRADIHFYWNVVWTIGLCCILWVTIRTYPSLEGAAVAQVSAVLLFSGIWFALLRKHGGIQLAPLAKILVRQIALILPMAAGVYLIRSLVAPDGWALFSAITAGVIVYGFTLFFFQPPGLNEFVSKVKK